METNYNDKTRIYESLVLSQVIPQLLDSRDKSPHLTQVLNRLQGNIVSFYNESVTNMFSTITHENSTRTHPTIAAIFPDNVLDYKIKIIKLTGNRYVIRSREDSPFKRFKFMVGFRNLMYPYITKEWGHIRESGLGTLWEKVIWTGEFLDGVKGYLGKQKYFEAVQRCFGNVKEPVLFHEATPVSIELISPIFAICGVLLGLGFIGFMAENKSNLIVLGKCVVDGLISKFIYVANLFKKVVLIKAANCCPAE